MPEDRADLLPNKAGVTKMFSDMLAYISAAHITKDRTIKQAALILRANECNHVDVEIFQVFVLYENCLLHRVCRNHSNIVALCQPFQKKPKLNKQLRGRREKNCDLRVSVQSNVLWSDLHKAEISLCARILRKQQKNKADTLKR